MTKKVALLALATMAALAFAATRTQGALVDLGLLQIPCPKQCGSGAENRECPENQCCNKDGSCGLGPKYCSTEAGCESGACFDNKRCLVQRDGSGKVLTDTCPNNQCCSSYGRCGIGKDYCGAGCQDGPCHDISCANGKPCPNNLCCRGKDKVCGLGGNYCTINGADGCQSGACYYKECSSTSQCTNGYCCKEDWSGKKSYCGLGRAYCGGRDSIPLFGDLVCILPPT